MADVVLITMPWDILGSPSLALGILHQLLGDAGLDVETRNVKLRWMEHLLSNQELRQQLERDPIDLEDYEKIACHGNGLGDWVFAEPPMSSAHAIDRYRALMEDGGDLPFMAKLMEMRRLVPAFLDRCLADVLASRPRVVGFTTTFCQNMASLALARRLKQADPTLRVVFGGANCEGPMGAALQRAFPWIDVVVRGEGEAVVPDLFRALVAGAPPPPVPGLCYFEDGKQVVVPNAPGTRVPMDSIPQPRYDDYFAQLEGTSFNDLLRSTVFLSYESARGCWWGEVSHCTFCGLNGASMAFRSKSPARVLDEMIGLARRYQVLDLHAVDNILDHGYFDNLLPAVERAGLDLQLFYEVKSNLKKRQIAQLRRAGVNRIQPGIESLSTPILKLMGKGVTAWQNLRLLKWCAQVGIDVEWNMLYGFPGEPEGEYRAMAELLPSLWHLAPPRAEPLAVHRFSPYHQRPEEHGIEVTGPAWQYHFLYDVDPADMTDIAYTFAFRHRDGRQPEEYTADFRQGVERWNAAHGAGAKLVYRRGPGFVQIRDGRAGRSGKLIDIVLEGSEADVYLACDDGARLSSICERTGLTLFTVQHHIHELAEERLVYREGDRVLGLAMPAVSSSPAAAEHAAADDEQPAPAGLVALRPRAAARR